MFHFFRAGGFSMWAIAAVGVALLVVAIKFARNADAQRLSLIRALTWSLMFITLTGFAVGLATTAKFVVNLEPADPLPYLLQGFAESSTNLMLGGGIASVTWFLVAVGIRRMPHEPT